MSTRAPVRSTFPGVKCHALCAVLLLAPGCGEEAGGRPDAAGGDLSSRDAAAQDGPATEAGLKDLAAGDGAAMDGGGAKAVCVAPIKLIDVSKADHVIGTGAAATCTAAALAAAASKGGKIRFNCGAGAVTIKLAATLTPPTTKDTVIDGGGTVTLDGQGKTRIFEINHANYRKNTARFVLQRLTLQNGKAVGLDYTPRDPKKPKCAYGYKDGAGGAVRIRDIKLHVVDCAFKNNQAATPGPDVGGGAIYAAGSLDVTIVGSSFSGNSGSNGGAVGLLQTTGTFVNTTFHNNKATGTGQNYVRQGCAGVGHANQGGAGGNGGAVSIDGADDLEQSFCGVTFTSNTCNELGGCVFRTANGKQRKATFTRCTLDGNTAGKGGGCLYISNSDFTLSQSMISNNTVLAGSGGGVRTALSSKANIVNSTFYNNSSPKGLMGALSHGGTGEIRNCTFALNKAEGGSTLFTAALGPAGPVTVYNTIFLNNTTREPYNPQACWFTAKKGANSFQWPRKRYGGKIDDTPCVEKITWADAKLGAPADNGGPTLTMMPAAGSPVAGAGKSCPAVDQRGKPRSTTTCAAGAVEP